MGPIQEGSTSEQLQRQTSREDLKDLRLDEAIKVAIKQGWPDTVKELLSQPRSTPKPPPEDQSPNPEADDDSNSETALMLACRLGHLDIVEILLEWLSQCSSQDQLGELPGSWTDTAAIDSNGNTALHLAAIEGHDQIVEIILQNNRDLLEKTNEKEKTALQLACESGKSSVVQLLLDNNANSSMSDDDDNMPIHEASWLGHLDIVKALLHANMEHLEKKNIGGNTAFLNAAQRGHPELLRYLISVGAHQFVSNKIKNTALHLASSADKENLDVVKILLEKASLEAENIDGRTPLLLACRNGNTGIVQLLLESGASSKIKDTLNQDTVLHLAACGGNLECFEGLYERLPDNLNERNGYGARPLHLACQFGHASIASFLLEKGADPRVKDDDNEDTPLHLAIRAENVDVVGILLKRDKDLLNLKNAKGKTALLVAGSCSSIEVVKFLLENEADIYSVDSIGESILHKAVSGSNIDLVKVLLERNMEIRPSHTGRTPLHLACYHYEDILVSKFLDNFAEYPSKKQELLFQKDDWGDTALGDAASSECLHIVLQLLKDPVYFSQDSSNYLATDKMCFSDEKERETVNKLLISELKNLEPRPDNAPDVSMQPHSRASGQRTEEIDGSLTEICYWAILNGCLELMQACVKRAKALKQDLKLQKGSMTWLHIFAIGFDWDLNNQSKLMLLELVPPDNRNGLIPDNRGITPLDLAVKYARIKTVESFLCPTSGEPCDFWKDILRRTLNERKDTAIWLAIAGRHRDITKVLWNRIKKHAEEQIKALNSEPVKHELDEQTMLALEFAARFEPPREENLLKDLLSQISKTKGIENDVFSLAIYHQFPKVVWWLLSNGAYTSVKDIEKGSYVLGRIPTESKKDGRFQQINDLLQEPPALSKPGAPDGEYLLTETDSGPINRNLSLQGTIMDFLYAGTITEAQLRLKRRPLNEIVYSVGPQKIMETNQVSYDAFFQTNKDFAASRTASEKPKPTQPHYQGQRGQRRADSSIPTNRGATNPILTQGKNIKSEQKAKESHQKQKHDVRWIHIPINDMNCLEDLMTKISIEKGTTADRHWPLRQFFNKSWSQLDVGKDGFMKPQCLRRSGSTRNSAQTSDEQPDEPKHEDTSFNQIALYIPFLSWIGINQHRHKHNGNRNFTSKKPPEKLSRKSQKHHIIHDYLTLDQYGHMSPPGMYEREVDQVLPRIIHSQMEDEMGQSRDLTGGDSYKMLIVNQLWLWVLDDKTILTSSTDELDEEMISGRRNSFLQCVLDSFQEQAIESALTTNFIVELILATAVELAQRKDIVSSIGHSNSPLSLFHDWIDEVQMEEKMLLDKFHIFLEYGTTKAARKEGRAIEYGNVSGESEYLLQLKDTIEELNILKNLIEDQHRVWKQFTQGDTLAHASVLRFDTPSDIKREVEGMMRQAEVVQTALQTLLNLKQKQASIEEARSSSEQSATIMVFTVITVIFLPATFLTGIFALNVTEFPHKGDDVAYEASWIFPIIILVSLGTSAIFSLFAFHPGWFANHRNKRGQHRSNWARNMEDNLVIHDPQSGHSMEHLEGKRQEKRSRFEALGLFRRKVTGRVGSPSDAGQLA